MPATKPISKDSVPGALAKAERYRLLNEPSAAESICLDILEVDPANHDARVGLILALTDQIATEPQAFARAVAAVDGLDTSYDRAYYTGIAWERRGKARYIEGGVGAGDFVYDWLSKALACFEQAETMRPVGNDDAILRWNSCVRFLNAHKDVRPQAVESPEAILSE
jgi:hypothetical protein